MVVEDLTYAWYGLVGIVVEEFSQGFERQEVEKLVNR